MFGERVFQFEIFTTYVTGVRSCRGVGRHVCHKIGTVVERFTTYRAHAVLDSYKVIKVYILQTICAQNI